ncbi:prepilin-type N-terminal cleavage/methylation domain-containing protein [Patescibacteria group bacterium]
MINGNKKGFTLLEVLLVVAIIAILAAIVIIAINPYKQLGDARNAQRWSDVTTISSAVYQYSIDNNGELPSSIENARKEICREGGTCTGLVNLSVLTSGEKYLVEMPQDPNGYSSNGAGYEIEKTGHDRVIIYAPDAEQGATIEVTR